MKKITLLFIIIISINFFACKKNAQDLSGYYITASFNGNDETFSDNVSAGEYSGDISAGFAMSAKDNANNKSISLNIGHAFGQPITTGIYKFPPVIYNAFPAGTYNVADSIFYGSGIDTTIANIQIAIINLTNTTVTGTFSGRFNNTQNANDGIVITNGSFNLPVH